MLYYCVENLEFQGRSRVTWMGIVEDKEMQTSEVAVVKLTASETATTRFVCLFGSSGRSLFQFLYREATRSISTPPACWKEC